MKEFEPVFELVEFISAENVEKLKDNFIKEKFDIENQPLEIDKDQGNLIVYDSLIGDTVTIKFKNKLEKLLSELTNQVKREINISSYKLDNREKTRFWYKLIDSIKSIEHREQNLINKFPVCKYALEDVKRHITETHNFNIYSQFEGNTYFTLLPKYSQEDLYKVYNFLTEELFIDDEIYSYQDFTEILFDKNSDKILRFNCQTQLAVCILKNMEPLFSDFTPPEIHNSQRFHTRTRKHSKGVVIKLGNYHRYVNRLKNMPSLKSNLIDKFFALKVLK